MTDRDVNVLYGIWEAGRLSREEVTERYFGGKSGYTYRRMWALRERGWVRSRRRWVNGRTVVFYELTEEGMEVLGRVRGVTGRGGRVAEAWGERVKKRNRSREWTERDVAILLELYRVRVLTLTQLEEAFFGGRRYGSKRLGVLRREGMIVSKVAWSKEKGHLEAVYRITEKGIRFLIQRGVITEAGVRARDLEPTEKQREYLFDINELHLRCQRIPFMDSRAVKRKYRLNRGSLVAGAFELEGKDYWIYMVGSGVKEQTVLKMANEIKLAPKGGGLGGFLVYAKDETARKAFEQAFEEMKVVTGGLPVHILPFDDRGIWITQKLIFEDSEHLLGILRTVGEIVPVSENRYGFRYGIRFSDGWKGYVLEVLSGERARLDRVLREYVDYQGVGVALVCWEDEAERYRERVMGARFMRVVPVARPTQPSPASNESEIIVG